MSNVHRPGVILTLPEWVVASLKRNNLTTIDLLDLSKLMEYISTDDILLLRSFGDILNRVDSDFSFINYNDVWLNHHQLLPDRHVANDILLNTVKDRLSVDKEDWENLYGENPGAINYTKYYDIEVVRDGILPVYFVILKQGFYNAISEESYRDKYLCDLYRSLVENENDDTIYDWHLPLANRYLKILTPSTQC